MAICLAINGELNTLYLLFLWQVKSLQFLEAIKKQTMMTTLMSFLRECFHNWTAAAYPRDGVLVLNIYDQKSLEGMVGTC